MPRTKRSEKIEHAPDGQRLYSLGDAQKFTGTTRARGEYWLRNHVIVPDYRASGSGNFHGFTFRNLIEIEIAARLSRFRVPVDLIRSGIHAFRAFHEQFAVLTDHGPADRANTLYTDAQMDAYSKWLTITGIPALQRQGLLPKRVPQKTRELYEKASRNHSEEHQRRSLQHAVAWERYRRDREYRRNHFFGLFVVPVIESIRDNAGNPIGGHTAVHSDVLGPIDLNHSAYMYAIVVNLGAVLSSLEASTQERL